MKCIKEIIYKNFKQDIDMTEHKIEFFINKHNDILIKNRNHSLNKISNEVLDFSIESYLSFILKSVYNNKTKIGSGSLIKLPLKHKLLISLTILQIYRNIILLIKSNLSTNFRSKIKKFFGKS